MEKLNSQLKHFPLLKSSLEHVSSGIRTQVSQFTAKRSNHYPIRQRKSVRLDF